MLAHCALFLTRFIHLLIILFVLLAPFLAFRADQETATMILILHVTTCLVLMLHWYLANDACFLTLVEKSIRGVNDNQSFIHSIVSPVYTIRDSTLRKGAWCVTPAVAAASAILILQSGVWPKSLGAF